MEILIKAAQMILILSIIVVLHEGGHYAAAKFFKTKVERFFLFFDVKFALFKKQIGETVYGIGWLPLGGYVKIAGMIDESMDTEQMKQPAQPWEFRSKPAWQRLIIMLAGIIVNLLLAMIIFGVMSYTNGEQYVNVNKLNNGIVVDSAQAAMGLKPGDVPVGVNGVNYIKLNEISKRALIDGGELNVKRNGETINLPINEDALVSMLEHKGGFFAPNVAIKVDTVFSVAAEAGLEKGDKILALNNEPINGWKKISETIGASANSDITFKVERNGEAKEIVVHVPEEAKIGIGPSFDLSEVVDVEEFGLGESIARGVKLTFSTITDQVQSFSVLWKLKGKATKYVSGPIGIAEQLPPVWDWGFFWSFTALLSAWLAFVNLLPIPGLDGGHAMFTLYEMVTGHKPGDKFMEVMQVIGFVFLMALMVFIFGNDIVNLIYN
ncbi:RIP metalloprotease RseP [Weeksellaceae bacterium KMM 9713]|uniref:Zinc metalloprotease n=1 Tax=Profundicola chukchiensis TaxID=2961959 RepID=A0A9X4RX16_9FLAO|nr:RIP metalloprotease RseP [Profundicola chukchiensis]MDG4945329.1 RIP metalloprotease RseP [Profundicola chukchiensis]